jgi:hypothetical protein
VRLPWRGRGSEQLPEHRYPSYVKTEAERHRWDMASRMAERVAEEIGGDATTVWLATRSLYGSDIPTD